MLKRFLWVVSAVWVAGCASSQLNYNALDLASSSDDLMTSQILSNLSKFRSFPYAIPSQVSIPSGSATTTNSITPMASGPLGLSATTTLANSVAAPLFNATTHTHIAPNGSIGASATDQWSQNWTLTPLQDPDQLRRLRALYRFGARYAAENRSLTDDKKTLLCEYPLVQKAQGSGASSGSTVNVYLQGPKPTCDTCKKPDDSGYNYTRESCPSDPANVKGDVPVGGKPDPAFLKPPGCIICEYDEHTHKLTVNDSLSNQWASFQATPIEPLPQDSILLGYYGRHYVYLNWEKQKEYSDFVLFVLEATLQSTSTSGGSSGKGSSQKAGAPAPLQLPAAPTILE